MYLRLNIQKTLESLNFILLAIYLLTVNGQEDVSNTNLPSKLTVPENTKTGTVVFRVIPVGSPLVNVYPDITSDAFSYNAETGEIAVNDGSLLDYEGYHKSFVMRFDGGVPTRKKRAVGRDLVLLIELQDVQEPSDFSGFCKDVSTLKWLVPVCSSIELLAMIICSVILLFCFFKKNNPTKTAVEEFRQ